MKRFKITEPVGPTVLVKVDEYDEKTQGGIIIPEKIAEKQAFDCEVGEVVMLSKTAYIDLQDGTRRCEPGDHVLYTRYAGHDIPIKEGNTTTIYRLVKDADVYAKVEILDDE